MPTVTSFITSAVGVAPAAAPGVLAQGVALPGGGKVTGTGSLVHPTVGTLVYTFQPSKWSGIDGDLLVFPVWQVEQTLTGRHAVVWPGSVEDVVCVEQWPGLPIIMSDILRRMYETPTDIENGQFCTWSPTYCSSNSYSVVIESLEVRGQGPAGSPPLQHGYVQTVHGWVTKEVTMALRIKSRA